MSKVIIYKDSDNGVSIISPATDELTVEQIALKDVPPGIKYKIIDATDVPTDRTFRKAWEVDEVLLTDGVGSDFGTGSTKEVVAYGQDGNPIIRGAEPAGYYDIEGVEE
jgi:hypothetical protein